MKVAKNSQAPLWSVIFLLLFVACSSPSHVSLEANRFYGVDLTEEQYREVVEKTSRDGFLYNGFTNVFEARVTLLTTELLKRQIHVRAAEQQWTEQKIKDEDFKVSQEANAKTKVFLSFFTPESKYNDLNKPKTTWKVFLDSTGKRYEGSIEKSSATYEELRTLYPRHTRWALPYVVTFAVPTSAIEKASPAITVTGPLGAQRIDFVQAE